MILPESSRFQRTPYVVIYQEQAAYKDTYAGVSGVVALKAHLLRPKTESKTVLVFMHPIGGGEYLPLPSALAKAGYHVIYCNSRYPGVDYALQMEKVALDLQACIDDAKTRLGYQNVILAGWSGGGSLSAFYQAEAEDPRVTATPWGDSVDLTKARLVPADGLMLLAAHCSRATTLTENLDPSILDENDPEKRDPELDIFNPDNPNQPPYSEDFLSRYRQAQIDRNRRITAWARAKLEQFKASGRENEEFGFVVHGTMADPRWLDPSIDPNEREAGTSFLGDPQQVNNGPVGLARFCTLRSWLSQWSLDESHADGEKCVARVKAPVLVLGNLADNICTPSHTQRLFDAISHEDKKKVEIPGATHYYIMQKKELEQAVSEVDSWLADHGFKDVGDTPAATAQAPAPVLQKSAAKTDQPTAVSAPRKPQPRPTAESGSAQTGLAPAKGFHHIAYRCRDAKQTRWFYEDVLGLPMTMALVEDQVPGTMEPVPFMHLFFELGNGEYMAFFDQPSTATPEHFNRVDSFDRHIAFEVDSAEELRAWQQRINAMGVSCLGPINHDFVQSMYMYDPNGLQVELTYRTDQHDKIMAEIGPQLDQMMDDWSAQTRAEKEERFGAEAIDQRSRR